MTTVSRTDRADARLDWLRTTLRDPTLKLTPASADASFRSYWRTRHGARSLIVMDSPPAQEDPRPWLAIRELLADAGLHVPAVFAQNLEHGWLLIEDLGSRLYLSELHDTKVDALYGSALDALLVMQSQVSTGALAPYDHEFLARELNLMPTWFLERHLGISLQEEQRSTLEQAFAVLLDTCAEQPQVFVHRDYHSRNLLIIEHNNPGIIDFQGAMRGPITYDLASLLRDCYIVWDDARVDAWLDAYRQRLQKVGIIGNDIDAARFHRWFDLTGLQRHIKVLGIFCRLWYRDGKQEYLEDLPRVYRYVMHVASRYTELKGLLRLLEQCAGDALGKETAT